MIIASPSHVQRQFDAAEWLVLVAFRGYLRFQACTLHGTEFGAEMP